MCRVDRSWVCAMAFIRRQENLCTHKSCGFRNFFRNWSGIGAIHGHICERAPPQKPLLPPCYRIWCLLRERTSIRPVGVPDTLRELCVDDGSYECPRRHGRAPTLSIAGARFVLYPSSFAVTPPALRGGKTSGPLPARLLCTEHFFGYLDKHMVQTHPRPGSPPCPLSYAIRFKKAAKENTVKPCRQT